MGVGRGAGDLDQLGFEISFFPYIFEEKCFPASFELVKCNFTMVGPFGKNPSDAHG